MRISDWSSDVCSSDLRRRRACRALCLAARRRIHPARHGCVTGDDDMNDQRKVKRAPSLLERAADMFGLDPAANAPTIDVSKLPPEPEKKAKKVKAAEHAAETPRSEEHTSELQSLMRISYAV